MIANVTLVVRDYDEAIAFYVGVLGFDLVEDTPIDGKRWVVVRPPGGGTGLVLGQASDDDQRARVGDQTGGRVAFFLHVDDFEEVHDRLRAAGVTFLRDRQVHPYGTVAVFEDLYGNRWDLIQSTP